MYGFVHFSSQEILLNERKKNTYKIKFCCYQTILNVVFIVFILDWRFCIIFSTRCSANNYFIRNLKKLIKSQNAMIKCVKLKNQLPFCNVHGSITQVVETGEALLYIDDILLDYNFFTPCINPKSISWIQSQLKNLFPKRYVNVHVYHAHLISVNYDFMQSKLKTPSRLAEKYFCAAVVCWDGVDCYECIKCIWLFSYQTAEVWFIL